MTDRPPPPGGAVGPATPPGPTTYRTVFLGYGGELLLDAFDQVAGDGSDESLEETVRRMRGLRVDGG